MSNRERRACLVARAAAVSLVVAGAMACTRTAQQKSDTVAVAASDSASASVPPAVTPQPPPTDTAAKTPPTTPQKSPSPTPAAATPTPTPSETVLTGQVSVTGVASDQRTMLRIEGGPLTTLTGALEPQLRRLNSATVWVAGGPVSGPPNATFAVSRYEIVSIEGAKPTVGVLMTRDGATWVAAERDTVKLAATTPEIRAKIGAKVWVVGRRTGSELTPQSFGVIREP